MRVVTVARKPCSEGSITQNVATHEAAALNIAGCRLATSDNLDGGAYSEGGRHSLPGDLRTGVSAGMFEEGKGRLPGQYKPPSGRWPPNIVLLHGPTCEVVGERKVATGTAHRDKSGGKTIFSETAKKQLPNMTYAGADGMETVPAWACEAGCSVAALDAQSGRLKSGSGTVKRASSKHREGNVAAAYGAESRPDGEPQVWYGDSGGASRFFKQFGGRDQST